MIDNSSRILPPSLDGRQQTNRSLGYFLNELQLGSVLQGTVSSIMRSGDVVISTMYGKFSIENSVNLSKGDRISLTISTDGENLFGIITVINNIPSKILESVVLQLISKPSIEAVSTLDNKTIKMNISNNIPYLTRQNLKANIDYLNLSTIDKTSILHQILSDVNNAASIGLKVIKDNVEKIILPHQFIGEVIEDSSNKSKQLIKTNFGILSTDNTNMPIGKKLTLEIQSVNDVNIYNKLNMLSINDFLFQLNDNWLALKQLLDAFIRFKSTDSDMELVKKNIQGLNSEKSISISDPIKDTKETLMKFLDPAINKQEIKTLSENLNKLKEFYMMPHVKNDDDNNWCSFFIPIFDGEQVIKNQILTQRKKNQILRFIIKMNLEKFGEIQIDGYIKLSINKIPESFDLTMRFKDLLNQELQSKISDIFLLYQNLSGIRGTLNFQKVRDFIDL